jgi:cytochrome P450
VHTAHPTRGPRTLNLTPRIHEIVDDLLDAVGNAPSFDLIDAFADPLPTIVIAEMLGFRADQSTGPSSPPYRRRRGGMGTSGLPEQPDGTGLRPSVRADRKTALADKPGV